MNKIVSTMQNYEILEAITGGTTYAWECNASHDRVYKGMSVTKLEHIGIGKHTVQTHAIHLVPYDYVRAYKAKIKELGGTYIKVVSTWSKNHKTILFKLMEKVD